jgi:type I restriction enzyme M protein
MFEQTFKNIDDVFWKEAGCTTELDYTEQTSWILFLKYLDDLEQERALAAELVSKPYCSSSINSIAGQNGPRMATSTTIRR